MLRVWRSLFLLLASMSGSAIPAHAQGSIAPPRAPLLRIDPGMHTAVVRSVSADKTCSLIASASEDKTVRLWSVAERRLVRTLRLPLGSESDEGKSYAVAMAPDASWMAVGGFTKTGGDHWVYIFDPATGQMITRFGRYPQVIQSLAISPDGRYLAITFRAGAGLRVWERRSANEWASVAQDTAYNGVNATGAAFDAHGVLYTVAEDGKLRRYAPGYRTRTHMASTKSGRHPHAISVNASSNELAVGFMDSGAVDIYAGANLAWQRSPDTGDAFDAPDTSDAGGGVNAASLASVSWSTDGSLLFAGGAARKAGRNIVRVWGEAGRGAAQNLEGPDNLVTQLTPCGSWIAFAAGDPALGIFDAAGQTILWQDRVGVDMREKLGANFQISANATRVRLGLERGDQDPVLLDLDMRLLKDAPDVDPDLHKAITTTIPVTGWGYRENTKPLLGETQLSLRRAERAQSLAIAPDKSAFALGGDYYLRMFDANGALKWEWQAPGVIWGVNFSDDGRILVAASGDGTLRWLRASDHALLLSAFVHASSRRWIAWTERGYFAASTNAEELIGWHVNRNADQAADFFPASRFRKQFYRPDIVQRVLADVDEGAAISKANANLATKPEEAALENKLPPVVTIRGAKDGLDIANETATVAFDVRGRPGETIKRIWAAVDGRPVEGAEMSDTKLDGNGIFAGRLNVKVSAKAATVSVFAEGDTVSVPAEVVLKPAKALASGPTSPPDLAPPQARQQVQPRVFALVVGIGKYQRSDLDLGTFATNDADNIAQFLKGQTGPGRAFSDATVQVLVNEKATQRGILAGIEWLRRNAKDRETDVALLYFSGHGASEPGAGAYLLPHDFDPDALISTAIEKSSIVNALKLTGGRVVAFVDACYGGAGMEASNLSGARRFDVTNLVNDFSAAENGIIAFASSSGNELSYPAPDGQNSAFTKALIEGLSGKAARADDTQILTSDLSGWLDRRVPKLTDGRQNPSMARSPQAKPVALAILP